jgi:hypothetical protein
VATSFPNSKDEAITIDDIAAPEKSIPTPHIEKNAAHPAINNAVNPNNVLKFHKVLIILI